ncbi:CPBP family intramembrane glutamic endopeptidase [Nocardioides okcheonensis]|uniref:CPBP family intramembrane glutamic endopeptidase n=1 Tax=Nocardioides okcheonensis TaxID=2894081 RepID=UPI0022A71B53|nr:CPBP family intramembrane glutamic endopeptidase [Nocardioides okcheonensis]
MTTPGARHDGLAATGTPAPTGGSRPDARPFGAHLRMAWWKPLLLLVALPATLLVLQVLALLLVGAVEGSDDPLGADLTPLKSLAVNASIGLTGVVALLLTARMARVPWRALLSTRRTLDRRRLVTYALGAVVLVGAALGATAVVSPESTGWSGFAVTGTTVGLLCVTLLTTPLQAIGEELTYRAALMPAVASWSRAVTPALTAGITVSALVFAAMHGSTDPWLAAYFAVVGLSTALAAVISGGMEAPIAFHVVNNVLAGVVGNLFSDGGTTTIDRTADTGDASLLLLVAANVAMVLLVVAHERRRAPSAGPTSTPA